MEVGNFCQAGAVLSVYLSSECFIRWTNTWPGQFLENSVIGQNFGTPKKIIFPF